MTAPRNFHPALNDKLFGYLGDTPKEQVVTIGDLLSLIENSFDSLTVTGNTTIGGTLGVAGVAQFAAGTVSAPSVLVGPNNTTNGFYQVSVTQLGVAMNAVQVFAFDNNGGITGQLTELTPGSGIAFSGTIRPYLSTDASAPNNSIYYSTDASKLVYKDGGGVVNPLY